VYGKLSTQLSEIELKKAKKKSMPKVQMIPKDSHQVPHTANKIKITFQQKHTPPKYSNLRNLKKLSKIVKHTLKIQPNVQKSMFERKR